MNDFKDQLGNFSANLKANTNKPPLQQTVVKTRREPEVKFTVYLKKGLHRKMKQKCVKSDMYIKDYINGLIEKDMNKKS